MGISLDVSEVVTLTPAQAIAWEETRAAFGWQAPAFMHLLHELCNPDKTNMVATFLGTERVPSWFIAGTNGKRLFLCAERFLALPLSKRIFVLAHEVCHPMLGHIIAGHYYRKKGYIDVGFKHLKYDGRLANNAMDYVINDMLINSRIGTFLETGLHDPTIGTYQESWIDVYEKLLDEQPGGKDGEPCEDGEESEEGNSGGSGKAPPPNEHKPRERNGQKGWDEHMGHGEGEPAPGQGGDEEDDQQGPPEVQDGNEAVSQEQMQKEMQKVQQAVSAAMEVAAARGKLPAALKQFCEKLLEPAVDWTEHVKSTLARRLGSGAYDFRRPDRRFLVRDIIVPGRSGHGANLIIVGGDSSGSIYAVPALTDRWMAECGGMVEDVKPRECHVLWCDATIQRVDILTEMADVHRMVHKGSDGGGGTSFVPVFEYCKNLNMEIDALVYLTDGDGTFPSEAPKFPVIWGDISGQPSKYPFGDVVSIPVPRKLQG